MKHRLNVNEKHKSVGNRRDNMKKSGITLSGTQEGEGNTPPPKKASQIQEDQ